MAPQVVVQAPPAPPPFGVEPPWMMLDPGQLMFIIVVAIVAATLVLWPIMRALGRRLEGRGSADELAELRAEVEGLRAQLADVTGGFGRVADLEERVDFAERLLAQQREPVRLEGGRPE